MEAASAEEPLPAFPPFRSLPEIRLDSGRINFKSQNQKKVYVIDALDLELRPPSSTGEPWKLWFEGTPNRTDFPLRPVSRVRGEAEFGRERGTSGEPASCTALSRKIWPWLKRPGIVSSALTAQRWPR